MKKRIITCAILCICIIISSGCKKEEKQSDDTKKTISITIDNEQRASIFGRVTKTDENIPEKEMNKVELGIKNWAQATLGIDSSYQEESKNILNEKFYEIIIYDTQREEIKKERNVFYENATITTEDITVEMKNANEAIYETRTIGYVDCTVTITGTRNDEKFERIYDLILLMDYQEDIASVYEVIDIKLK